MKATSTVRAGIGLAALLAAAWPASPARAGGIEVGDQNPRAAGRGGAFAARADDPTAMEYNPAGLARLRGTHVFLANRFILGTEEYHRARTLDWSEAFHGVPRVVTFPAVSNETPNQYLGPMLMVSSDFGLKDWAFALGVYAPPGTMSQRFPLDGPQKYMLTERTVQILYYNAAAAWKYKDVFGIGLTFQWVDVTSLKFNLVIDGNTSPRLVKPDSSRFDILSSVTGSDHVNTTVILGLWYRPVPGLDLAVSARMVPVSIRAKSSLSIQALNLKLDKPPALTRDGRPDDSVTFSFTLPPRLRLGARYAFRRGDVETGDIELDFGYEAWSMLDAFVLDGSGLVSTVLGQNVPIGRIVVPRNWRDVYSLRLGGDWNVLPGHVTLRGGFTWESSAAPDAYAYVDVFPGQRLGPSGGFSLEWWGVSLSASYTYLFALPVVVTEDESRVYQQTPGSPCQAPYTDPTTCSPHYVGIPAATSNAGVYVSRYHLVSVALGYRF